MTAPVLYEVFKKCLRCGRGGPGKSFLPGPADGSPISVRTCTKCSDELGRELKLLTGHRRPEPTADTDSGYPRRSR